MTGIHRSLIIPMYQEAPRIEVAVRELGESPLRSPRTEIIFVDDGSRDGTPDLVERLLEELAFDARVLRLDRNRGKGAAVRAGVLAARGEAIAFVDADLSAGIDEVDRCLKWIESGQAEVVITSRAREDSVIVVRQPPLRQLSGKLFNTAIRLLGLTEYPDTQCGLKAFSRDAAHQLFEGLTITGFAFDVEVLLRARTLGFAVAELPIQWRHWEASRVNALRDSPRMLRDVLMIWWKERRGTRALSDREMSEATFAAMAELEREHWWFRAKRELVAHQVADHGEHRGVAVDVGCGTGAMVDELRRLGFTPAMGTDLSRFALTLAAPAADDRSSFAAARAEHLPLRAGAVSVLVSLDVIEHLDDDVAALAEYARVLRPDGLVVLAVPAYEWAWSDHDVQLGHRRRYTAGRLCRVAAEAGLVVERCTYFHSWLVPIAFMLRKTPLRRALRGQAEEASFVHPLVNRWLARLTSVERQLLRRTRLPFGLSVLLVARRPVERSPDAPFSRPC